MNGLREFVQRWLLPKPTSSYCGIEVGRCTADGQLITPHMDLSRHGGHRVISPIVLNWKEKLLIRLKLIE